MKLYIYKQLTVKINLPRCARTIFTNCYYFRVYVNRISSTKRDGVQVNVEIGKDGKEFSRICRISIKPSNSGRCPSNCVL